MVPALLAIVVAGACGGDGTPAKGGAAATRVASKGGKTEDSAGGSVDLGRADYKPGPLAATGSVEGTITLEGAPRIDTIQVPVDQPVCGKTAEGPVSATAKGLSNAVVWIADM